MDTVWKEITVKTVVNTTQSILQQCIHLKTPATKSNIFIWTQEPRTGTPNLFIVEALFEVAVHTQ
jgi:hypothetical protein